MGIEKLNRAKINKNDEFYTQYKDIEKELKNYNLTNKVIYCNCDTTESEFYNYFKNNFDIIKPKKVYFSSIHNNKLIVMSKNNIEYIILEETNSIPFDYNKGIIEEINKETDIFITNPPFSKIRSYFTFIHNTLKKDFIILFNILAIKSPYLLNEIIKDNIRLGYKRSCGLWFKVDEIIYSGKVLADGTKLCNVGTSRWLTSLPITYEPLFSQLKEYKNDDYKFYDDSEILFIDKSNNIPDYGGLMGVPLTFYDKYNKNQFEILKSIDDYVDGKLKYSRLLIRKKQ